MLLISNTQVYMNCFVPHSQNGGAAHVSILCVSELWIRVHSCAGRQLQKEA